MHHPGSLLYLIAVASIGGLVYSLWLYLARHNKSSNLDEGNFLDMDDHERTNPIHRNPHMPSKSKGGSGTNGSDFADKLGPSAVGGDEIESQKKAKDASAKITVLAKSISLESPRVNVKLPTVPQDSVSSRLHREEYNLGKGISAEGGSGKITAPGLDEASAEPQPGKEAQKSGAGLAEQIAGMERQLAEMEASGAREEDIDALEDSLEELHRKAEES